MPSRASLRPAQRGRALTSALAVCVGACVWRWLSGRTLALARPPRAPSWCAFGMNPPFVHVAPETISLRLASKQHASEPFCGSCRAQKQTPFALGSAATVKGTRCLRRYRPMRWKDF